MPAAAAIASTTTAKPPAIVFWVLKQPSVNMVLLVVAIVAIGALSVIGSLLWKRANEADPARRSDTVLAGEDAPRSRAHYGYVGLEVLKVAALVVTGVLLLAG